MGRKKRWTRYVLAHESGLSNNYQGPPESHINHNTAGTCSPEHFNGTGFPFSVNVRMALWKDDKWVQMSR